MHQHMKISIWFFIGALLLIYGVLIVAADLWGQSHPSAQTVVLAELRAGLWWGAFLVVLGAFYCVKFRPGKE